MSDDAIASPLNLLSEEEHAREVLLLSFTLNLEFWERYALSVARGLGARVTVVGDAAMTQGEPGHVHHAGITYLDGRAVCKKGGAFHPKLLVIADEDYATVAIGSGNATLSGWHDNAELWTVMRGDSSGAPDTFSELAAWLRGLSEYIRFSGGVESAFARVAGLLEQLPPSDVGPRLLTSRTQPILGQLPQLDSGVDELVVASPFYDRASTAFRALIERLEPERIRLLLQPRDIVASGDSLAVLLGERGEQAESIASDRYYHGKLIEWVTGGRRFALTGSPNLSSSALQRTLVEGGNCELAVLSEITVTLTPPSGGTITHDELAAIIFDSRFDAPPAITLLGVMLGPDRIVVTLARPLADVSILEYAVSGAWEVAAVLPAHRDTVELEILLAPGCAVRVRQGVLVSNVCFAADPTRFSRTRVEHVGRVRTDEEDVFRDASVANAFAHDLAELRQFLVQPQPSSAGLGGGGSSAGSSASFTSWEEYLDACEAHIGERLLAYGLALPAVGVGEGRRGEGRREEANVSTLEEEGEESVASDTDAAAGVEPDTASAPPHFGDLAAHQRRRYQRWCERLAELSSELPFAGRLVALRLILDAVRGELFPRREEWFPIVARATEALGVTTEAFDEERRKAASLAAVALAAMRGTLRHFGAWEALRFPYERAASAVVPLLEHADADVIERYAAPLESFFGLAVRPSAVEALIASLLVPDPIAEATRLAEEELGLSAERRGSVIELNNEITGDPRRTLLAVVSLCEKATVAVSTPSWAKHRSFAVWRAPELVLVTHNRGGVRGALYELRGFGPGTFKDDLPGLPKPREEWARNQQPPERARMLIEMISADLL